MTNREKAIELANRIDDEIIETVKSGRSFRVEAGAGTGKTYSLQKVVEWIAREKREQFTKKQQSVACITYTNAAVDVINERLDSNSFIKVCTIHTFAWGLIKQFQSSLIKYVQELNLLSSVVDKVVEKSDIRDVKKVTYTLGVRYRENDTLYLRHEDVINLFVKLLENRKFRLLLAKKYPLILIDEYQDSFRSIINQFLYHFINANTGPQFGLFGDSWQTIYESQGACGLVESENIKVINKVVNFRSQENIVNALNNIRPSLTQISAIDDNDGKITVITTNEITTNRIKSGYNKGDFEDDFLSECIKKIDSCLDANWTGKTKKLMLTHKILSKHLNYRNLLDFMGEHLKNRDDEHFLFFQNKIEPIYEALTKNDAKTLFDVIGVRRTPIENGVNKQQWKLLKKDLIEARKKTIRDVLEVVVKSGLVDVPPSILEWTKEANKEESNRLYLGKNIKTLYSIQYCEVINAIAFYKPESDFSTDHGVKGEEYDNVFIVIGRGWNDYRFDEQLYLDISTLDEKRKEGYIRNLNLFYVCCSRPKKNLAILITVPINDYFRRYLVRVFGIENLISYTEFIKSNEKE